MHRQNADFINARLTKSNNKHKSLEKARNNELCCHFKTGKQSTELGSLGHQEADTHKKSL